jgi:hypothetical protein
MSKQKPTNLPTEQFIGNFLLYMFFTFSLFVVTMMLGKKTTELVGIVFAKDTHLTMVETGWAIGLAVFMTFGWCVLFLLWKKAEKKCLEGKPTSVPAESKVKAIPARRKRR